MTYFAQNVKLLARAYLGSENKLAIKMGITRQSLSIILKTNNPNLKTLIKIHEIFNISIDDLVFKELSVK